MIATRKPSNYRLSAYRLLLYAILFSGILTLVAYFIGESISSVPHEADYGASWYYWKLISPSFETRLSAWLPYLLHQIIFWYLIYIAQKQKLNYSSKPHKINLIAILMNAIFVLIHYLQTYYFYDGLAQDVTVWSSQGSVILLLVWVILMSNNERGIFFGMKANFKESVVDFAKKYHGYIFAWATVYTFWFHPVENTSGHLIGFFYMFMLFIQGSLFFTKVHVNKYWRALLETFVLFHGTLVAINQGTDIWPMFLFGFWGAYILIYMWGISKNFLFIAINLFLFVIAWLLVWSRLGFENSHQTVWIPTIHYVFVFLLYIIIRIIIIPVQNVKDTLHFTRSTIE